MVFVWVRQTDHSRGKKAYTGLFLHSGTGLSQEGLVQLLVSTDQPTVFVGDIRLTVNWQNEKKIYQSLRMWDYRF